MSPKATANRLRTLRAAYGITSQKLMAERLKIEHSRYNNMENSAPLSKEVALSLVLEFPGLTLDWLYFGRTSGLTVSVADRIAAAEAQREQSASDK